MLPSASLPVAIHLQRQLSSPKLLDSFMDWMLLKAFVLLYLFPFSYENELLQSNHCCVGEVCRQHREDYSVSHVEIQLKRCVCRYNLLQVPLPVG